MGKLLSNFRTTILLSLALALGMVLAFGQVSGGFGDIFWQATLRWVHVVAGILWIGLLYYFNFVQIRVMPNIPAELKPAIGKHIAPEALFWFRWSALVTVVAGLGVMLARGHAYAAEVLSFGFAGGLTEDQKGLYAVGGRNLAGRHHVPERLGHHLAEPEAGPGHCGRGRRRQGQGRPGRHAGQPHQSAAVAADADLDGDVPDAVWLIRRQPSTNRSAPPTLTGGCPAASWPMDGCART